MMRKYPSTVLMSALVFALAAPAITAHSQPVLPRQGAEPATAASSVPVHTYRLLFTVTESDSGKRVGVQHFAMTAVPNQKASMKQGSKIPVMTGGYSHESTPGTEYQFTYLDVGLNCDVTLTEKSDGVEAAIKLEQSSVAETPSVIADVKEPIIRQAVLMNAAMLKPGTPVMMGSLDVPGSTRHLDIEVTLERVM